MLSLPDRTGFLQEVREFKVTTIKIMVVNRIKFFFISKGLGKYQLNLRSIGVTCRSELTFLRKYIYVCHLKALDLRVSNQNFIHMKSSLPLLSKFVILCIFTLLMSSCSFNRMFLYPTRLTNDFKGFRYSDPNNGQIIEVRITGDNYQPVFLTATGDSLNQGFTIESVCFKSQSGNMLNGWFLKPLNDSADITLLHLHGNAGCLFSQLNAISAMTRHNFQIFMFDYSGFGFSEGKATKSNVLLDAFSAFEYLKTRPEVKNTRLVIYGQSLGGHAAAVLATEKQNEIDGLVTEGAFTSHKDIAAYRTKSMMGMGFVGRFLVRQSYCAKKSIKDFHKPVLIIHSKDDQVIPFFMGKDLFECANEPKEFFEIRHEHINGPVYYSKEISEKIRKMLEM
jgi:uncharacterized protein